MALPSARQSMWWGPQNLPSLIPALTQSSKIYIDPTQSWLFFLFLFIFIHWRLITLQYCSGFCHTLTWISHGFTCIPHPDPPSCLPPHPIPLGLPSAPALSLCLMHPTWAGGRFTLDSILVSMLLSQSIPPSPSPTESKVCSVHLCLYFCPAYRVIVTIFLNSIYMH